MDFDYAKHRTSVIFLQYDDQARWKENSKYAKNRITWVTKELESLVAQSGEWSTWFDFNHITDMLQKKVVNGVYMLAESYNTAQYSGLTSLTPYSLNGGVSKYDIDLAAEALPLWAVKYIGRSTNIRVRMKSYQNALHMDRPPVWNVLQHAFRDQPEAVVHWFTQLGLLHQRRVAQKLIQQRNFWVRICPTADAITAGKLEEFMIRHYSEKGVVLWNSLTYPNKLLFPPGEVTVSDLGL